MSKIYEVEKGLADTSHVNAREYKQLYKESIENPDLFWSKQAEAFIDWEEKWDQISRTNMREGEIAWFLGAKLNVAQNCLDRHLQTKSEKTAIIWEGDNPNEQENISYKELHKRVSRLANGLKSRGIVKGDRVCIYLPMIPEAAIAMLACARIGAIHSVVFGGFSPQSLRDRIQDSECCAVITADEGLRGGKSIPLKQNSDIAVEECPSVHSVIVVQRTGGEIKWNTQKDIWYHDLIQGQSDNCPIEIMDSEDPLFILYTSGSTGKPKGVQHSSGGYLLHAAITHKYVFNYEEDDVYWCTADVGWITGHSYIVYGPLANGATTLMFEGVPTYPDASRFWQVIDKHQVNIFYTAPTALRQLMSQGDEFVSKTDRRSLKLLGSVGEPINPEAWEWYYQIVGDKRCPIVDTWWQTETGGIMITPLPGATSLKPGSATLPFFGIQPALMDSEGNVIEELEASGNLVVTV